MNYLLRKSIELVIRFFGWIYKILGINGILFILLGIECFVIFQVTETKQNDYYYGQKFVLSEVTDFNEIDKDDKRLVNSEIDTAGDDYYYLATLKVQNYYGRALDYIPLNVKTDDDNWLISRPVEYYADTDYLNRTITTTIPAGAEKEVSLIIQMNEEERKDIEHLTFFVANYMDIEGEELKEDSSITIDFVP